MKNTQPPITLDEAIYLRKKLEEIYFPNEDKKVVYDSKEVKQFLDIINSERVGIPKGTSPKQIGIKLEEWYEFLNQVQTNTTEIPQYEAQTTTTGLDLETKIEQAEKRDQQNADIRAREKQAIEDYIKQNEERIAKAKSLQEKLKDKVVYAKVVIPEEEKLTQGEQKELEILVAKAKNDTPVIGKVLTPKQELIDDFTLEIEKKLEPVLKDLPEKEKEIIARTYAVEIVEKIANPEVVVDERVQTVILDNIARPKQEVVTKILQKDDELITLAKNGAVLIATKQKDNFSSLETITTSLVGPKIASKILGKQNYQVTFSEVQVQGETTHTVRFGELNQNQIQLLTQENSVLTTLQQHGQQFGYDKINSVFTTYLKGKVESLPAGSVIKKAYKDPIVQSIFARYGMAEPVVWQAVGQSRFVGLVMKIAPDTAGPVLGIVGKVTGKQLVAPIATKVTGQVTGKAVAGKVAGQVAAKAGLSAFIASLGIPIPGVNVIIGAIAWLGTELVSKAKVLWQKHKEKIKPILAVGATIAAIRFLGVGPGLGVGAVATFGLMGTAGLSTIAFGGVRLLGLIGRSVGIAIATPVIVTLLVLPPLVAFIMLVINNSAYVVPPSPPSSESGLGSEGLPGVACTEVKLPTSITFSVDSPIATRAWEIVEDLYQGFWCYWNRSPGDLDTDVTTYPDSYPELFDMDEYIKNPNPSRGAASSCGECMFWCTWLVQKSYKESGYDLLYTLWSPTMYDDFNKRDKILNERDLTKDNIQMGAVIFFDVKNSEDRIDHVAIVYSVSSAGVKFVQSNSGTKDDFVPFGTDGVLQNPSYATIKGVGNP